MTLTPLLDMPIYLQIHVASAALALILGPVAIYRNRRDVWHKAVGYVWLTAIVVTAISSFWIQDFAMIGPLSPIHIFAVLALWGVVDGLRTAMARNFVAHAETLKSVYWNGVILAGLFNFLPGRRVNQAVFDGPSDLGWLIIGAGGAVLVWRVIRRRRAGGGIRVRRA